MKANVNISAPYASDAETSCDKLNELAHEVEVIERAIEWAASQGWRLCEVRPDGFFDAEGPTSAFLPLPNGARELAMRALGIDPVEVERERRAHLDTLRAASAQRTASRSSSAVRTEQPWEVWCDLRSDMKRLHVVAFDEKEARDIARAHWLARDFDHIRVVSCVCLSQGAP